MRYEMSGIFQFESWNYSFRWEGRTEILFLLCRKNGPTHRVKSDVLSSWSRILGEEGRNMNGASAFRHGKGEHLSHPDGEEPYSVEGVFEGNKSE